MSRNLIRAYALCTTALATMAYGGSALAQGEGGAADEVVVTGSRIITNGFAQPTPVTVVTMEQMQATAPNSLSEALNQLPQFKASFVSASTAFRNGGGDGGNFINLRGLSPKRTLTLLDGKRVVQSQATGSVAGAVDLNLLPQALVRRVDVVTGGASAAYGADALSGVVNFVLDTRYTGIKGGVRYGISQEGDNESYNANVAFGRSFAGGRGHILASAEYNRTMGVKDFSKRDWAQDSVVGSFTTTNPTPQTSTNTPTRVVQANVRTSNMTTGGLILNAGAPGEAANLNPLTLRDRYFVGTGPNASLMPFQVGGMRNATTQIGAGEPGHPDYGIYNSSVPPQTRVNLFLRGSWDLTPDWTVYAEGLYGNSQNRYRGTISSRGTILQPFTIFSDNPYLPATVVAQMGTAGSAPPTALYNPATGLFNGPTRNTITIGRLNTDWGFHEEFSTFSMARAVLGIDGKVNFGSEWNVSAYYTHGESIKKGRGEHNPRLTRLFDAIDSVASPGGAGLPAAGTPICRSSLTNPTNGCLPLNVIGHNAASEASLNWIYSGGSPTLKQNLEQDVVEVTFRGEPFSLWAGPVSMGGGASWRKESLVGSADAISESYNPAVPGAQTFQAGLTPPLTINGFPAGLRGGRGGWETTNPGSSAGSYSTKEVFAEVLIPLLRDHSFARSFDLNGAIRYADYSTSGGVLNWKVGLTYRPFDDLRIRTTRSRDIRAANLADLYQGITQNNPAVSDPFRRGTTGTNESNPNAITRSQGNPTLTPEIGDTFTLGMVYQPSWIQGFSFSVDYYQILITDAIANANSLTQCFQGNTALCSFIIRNTDPASFGAGNTIGPIIQVQNVPSNLTSTKNSGLDIEASYRMPLNRFWDGREDVLTFRVLANYTGKNSTFTLGGTSVTNTIGVAGGGIIGGTGGNQDWGGSINLNYQNGPLTINWQTRMINEGRIVANVDEEGNPYPANTLVNPNPQLNGQVPNMVERYFYSDLSVNYKFGQEDRFEAFLTINNLFDKDPPKLGSFFFYGLVPTNFTTYDTIGRQMTTGVRFRF